MTRANTNEPDAITADQAAALLGISRNSVYAAAREGEIPVRRIRRRYVFSRSALTHWLRSATVAGPCRETGPQQLSFQFSAPEPVPLSPNSTYDRGSKSASHDGGDA